MTQLHPVADQLLPEQEKYLLFLLFTHTPRVQSPPSLEHRIKKDRMHGPQVAIISSRIDAKGPFDQHNHLGVIHKKALIH